MRREVKENAQTSKRYQRGFEPGLSRLRVRHSTTEPPRSTNGLRHLLRRSSKNCDLQLANSDIFKENYSVDVRVIQLITEGIHID